MKSDKCNRPIVIMDAEEYNRPYAEAASRLYYAFLITGILIICVWVWVDGFPWLISLLHRCFAELGGLS